VSDIHYRSAVEFPFLSAPDGSISLADHSEYTKVLVRADRKTAAGKHLKVSYGRSRSRDGILICGSRPDEWTLLSEAHRSTEVAESVPRDGFVSVVDITHARTMFRISGSCAVDALAKVCNVDLADHMTPDGAVFSGSIAKVGCDVVRNDQEAGRSYLIACERSFGKYLFAVVADACAEFGIAIPSDMSTH